MKQKRIYQKARMFSVELTSQSQLLSASSFSVSGSNSTPGYGLMHGSIHGSRGNLFE